MAHYVDRELRHQVRLDARVRSEEGWSDAVIANVSSRGLMLQAVTPPPRRSYIEIRRGGICIVGRVMWSRDGRCGVLTQTAIDVADLRPAVASGGRRNGEERRSASRGLPDKRRPTTEEQAEASRRWGMRFEFAVILTIVAGGGLALTDLVATKLRTPIETAAHAIRLANRDKG